MTAPIAPLDNAFLRALAAQTNLLKAVDGFAKQPRDGKLDKVESAAFFELAKRIGLGDETTEGLQAAFSDPRAALKAAPLHGASAAAAHFPKYFDFSTMKQLHLEANFDAKEVTYADAKGNVMRLSYPNAGTQLNASFASASDLPENWRTWSKGLTQTLEKNPPARLGKQSIEFVAEKLFAMLLRDGPTFKPDADGHASEDYDTKDLLSALSQGWAQLVEPQGQ